MLPNMDYGLPTVNPYAPLQLSGHFDAFVQNTHTMQDTSSWGATLQSLRSQRRYLEDLLSKTATTLNVLRDKQTRNERVLSTHPTPRSKRKKVLQNRWRTNRTIQTCENEERVILDCLQVCANNIVTLEAIFNPSDLSSTAAEYNSSNSYASYADSESTSFDWNGWKDDGLSPFQRDRERSLALDEIPPEACADDMLLSDKSTTGTKRPPPLPPRRRPAQSEAPPPAPPNTARTQFLHATLSPEAAVFEPSVTHDPPVDDEMPKELDKLSISGLLSSKRMQLIQKRRFSDAAIGHLFHRLSSNARPGVALARAYSSWAAPSCEPSPQGPDTAVKVVMKRTNSF